MLLVPLLFRPFLIFWTFLKAAGGKFEGKAKVDWGRCKRICESSILILASLNLRPVQKSKSYSCAKSWLCSLKQIKRIERIRFWLNSDFTINFMIFPTTSRQSGDSSSIRQRLVGVRFLASVKNVWLSSLAFLIFLTTRQDCGDMFTLYWSPCHRLFSYSGFQEKIQK